MAKVGLKSIVAIWAKGSLYEGGCPFPHFSLGLGVTFGKGNEDPFRLEVGQDKATSLEGVSKLPAMTWEGGDALEQWMTVDGKWYEFDEHRKDEDGKWRLTKEVNVPAAAKKYDMYVQDLPGMSTEDGAKVDYAFRQQGGVRRINGKTNLITQATIDTGTMTGTFPDLVWTLP